MFYSQPCTRQDEWVVEKTGGMRGGYFVEVGAHDGIHHSNTLHLERELGWGGVLVEANPDLYQSLLKNRPEAHCLNVACGAMNGDDEFILGDAFGGLKRYMPSDWLEQHDFRGNPTITVPVRTLDDIVRDVGIGFINYLSVDVEGAEYDILEQFFFGRYRKCCPKLISVEFRYEGVLLERLRELLEPKGYVLDRVNAFDALFERRDQ